MIQTLKEKNCNIKLLIETNNLFFFCYKGLVDLKNGKTKQNKN